MSQINGDLTTYFNWSANALCPINPKANDIYLQSNQSAIFQVAQQLLQDIHYRPRPIYRGIILKEPILSLKPHRNLKYLSFSDDLEVAQYFADVNGFGSQHVDVATQLGTYGYVIEYTPKLNEVLFHYDLLSILPYAEAFSLLGMHGEYEIQSITWQKEIMILQPNEPFTNIQKYDGDK